MPYAREAAKISQTLRCVPVHRSVPAGGAGRHIRRLHLGNGKLQRGSLCPRVERGDQTALDQAVAIRKLFDGKALVSGIKALLAHIHDDPALARVKPPMAGFQAAERASVIAGHDTVRAKRVA